MLTPRNRARPKVELPPRDPYHRAYAVVTTERGRVVERRIYSEATPTLTRMGQRTHCIARSRSRFSYGRAERALRRKLGW